MIGIELVMQVLKERVDIPVVARIPRNRPERYIRLVQGAVRQIQPTLDEVPIIIQVTAAASDLDWVLDTITALRGLVEDISIYHPRAFGWEEDSGPHESPDPDLPDSCRWQFTGMLYMAS